LDAGQLDVQDKSWTPEELDAGQLDVQDKSWTPEELDSGGIGRRIPDAGGIGRRRILTKSDFFLLLDF
jgi:hypothetical protein